MYIYPRTLSLITTHQCTAACDHCCFGCTPKVHKHVPVKNLHRYIDQATEIPTFELVVFTGGECFLLGKDLDDLVGRANNHGYATRFVSNGYWATSPKVARDRVDRLAKNGLKEANFSTGDFHSKYVNPAYIQHGAMACADAGLTSLVMIELFKDSTFDFDGFINTPGFKEYVESRRVVLKASPWMSFDGEADLKYSSQYVELMTNNTHGCSSSLDVVAINPDEHLISCCGLTLEEIEELHLGDLKERTIAEILSGVPTDFIKIWIHLKGPRAIVEYARRYDESIELPKDMAHICEVCRYMYHNPKVADVIREHPPEDASELVASYYSSLIIKQATSLRYGSVEAKQCVGEMLRDPAHLDATKHLVTLVRSCN